MQEYQVRDFLLPALEGISDTSVKAHVELYAGYVKNFNAITTLINTLATSNDTSSTLAIAELTRRQSFEWGGMRLHELYFEQCEGGATALSKESACAMAINTQYGNLDTLIAQLVRTGMMRGPGWSIAYYDAHAQKFHIGFSEEQHVGHFASLPVILALDVWEHAYLLDHGTQGKRAYIDAFFKNVNWEVVEKRFAKAQP